MSEPFATHRIKVDARPLCIELGTYYFETDKWYRARLMDGGYVVRRRMNCMNPKSGFQTFIVPLNRVIETRPLKTQEAKTPTPFI